MGVIKLQYKYDFKERSTNDKGCEDTLENEHVSINRHGNLTVLYANAQSVISKMNELEAVADGRKPDIIAIIESWTNY